jgi:histidinol-phosphate aminotransferase
VSVLDLARAEILALKPYSSARLEAGTAEIMLNANEAPWPPTGGAVEARLDPLNRYPDPQPARLVTRLAELYGVDRSEVLVGRGSDEAIDLLIRAFCRPGIDAIAIQPPTFGMYAVSASVQGASVVEIPLNEHFELDVENLIDQLPDTVRIVFLCSPNNPTGACVPAADIARLAVAMRNRALIVVDEAYIEFAEQPSVASLIPQHENLGVLRTLSKAWALAGARVGCLLARAEVVALLRRIMAPYPLPSLSIAAALSALTAEGLELTQRRIALLISERERMAKALVRLPSVINVLPSQANFLCVEFTDSSTIYRSLLNDGILVRDVGRYPRLRGHLRISIGTREENTRVLEVLVRHEVSA